MRPQRVLTGRLVPTAGEQARDVDELAEVRHQHLHQALIDVTEADPLPLEQQSTGTIERGTAPRHGPAVEHTDAMEHVVVISRQADPIF